MKTYEDKFKPFTAKPGTAPINCNNDAEMIREGLRFPVIKIDRIANIKTIEEMQLLKQLKRNCGKVSEIKSNDKEIKKDARIYLVNEMTTLTNEKKFFHTTRSYKNIALSDLDGIINNLKIKGYKIKKSDLR